MQIRNFSFTQEPDLQKVLIQIIGDGEGGVFWWKDVPDSAKRYLHAQKMRKPIHPKAAEKALEDMWEFWEQKF